MNRATRQGSSVRTRVLLLAILPVIFVSVLLSSFYITDHQRDLAGGMEQFGRSIATGIAAGGALAVYAGDREGLIEIASSATTPSNVHRAAFYHADGELIAAYGELTGDVAVPPVAVDSLWRNDNNRGELYWYFRAPVRQDTASIADYEEAVSDAAPLLGWSMVAVSQEELQQTNRNNIVLGLSVSLGAILLVGFLAFGISRRIYQPIRDLTVTVETMEGGDLGVQANVAGDREVRILARVINRLATNLNETNLRLSREVEAATADLKHRNADLEVTRDELEKAMGARDQFLARMSHELRTPLTTIIGFTRRLEHTTLDAEQDEYRHAIQHASGILVSVIDDIIDFARMEHGTIELDSLGFDLDAELEDLLAMHAPSAYEKSLEMVLLIDADVPRACIGDPARLRQVVSNLLANAVKFTHEGEIVLRASVEDGDVEAGDSVAGEAAEFQLHVEVRDSGIGIAAEDMDKLFQPFSQGDTSIRRRFGGSGLGLVICRQLIELMGGQIGIDSTPGEGTSVEFSVPLRQQGNATGLPVIPARADAVAVIDANPWSRRALRTQLTYWSRQVFAFAQVDEFAAHLENTGRDFTSVLVNPGNCGAGRYPEVVAGLRWHYPGQIILLICPGDAGSPFVDVSALGQGHVRSLVKPVRREKLLAMLQSTVDGEACTAAGEEAEDPVGPDGAVTPAPCLQGLDILVAEDNSYNRRLIQGLLEAGGASVRLAEDGAQAVQEYRHSPCELVLMDGHMPGMDGIQACREIVSLARENGHSVAVVGLTADLVESEKQRFLEAGAVDVLFKPFEEQALLAALCHHVGRDYTENYDSMVGSAAVSKADLYREMQALMARMRQSLAQEHMTEAQEIAHQLQGLTGIYGLLEIRRGIVELAEGLQMQKQPDLQERLRTLEVQINEIVDEQGE